MTTSAAAQTRERILQTGLNLLSEAGLPGVTLGVLAQQVGMSKSGLFAHFRSKEEVQLALLEHMSVIADACVLQPALQAAEGLPRLEALVSRWFGWPAKAGLRGGCPISAALFELDDIAGNVRSRVLELEARWRALLGQLVRRSVELGHLRADLDADQFVWELCGIYLSHHASYRFLKDPRADERAQIAFGALLDRSRQS
ncbi:TetR/AcrR family transcriptional regulator [Gloeobacter kilaueensis]|uniref:TetR family transcriptional regulator n=1 Tax=Gloeobacter kilaueensis (strain ATCC BAA-2537 / CCAP 1431/1 / ULC 316 / JS1) TaxID=1183438 RepID=U5QDJ3_GLOK1|nr:TetR/AcrR family transcriptional regulator [Gloeobacter kilaueensis]AGY57002.1 TetR family transcriptional regulator [Gloeobacter kilaueensis JS1]